MRVFRSGPERALVAAMVSISLLTTTFPGAFGAGAAASGVQGSAPDQPCEVDVNRDGVWDIQDIALLANAVRLLVLLEEGVLPQENQPSVLDVLFALNLLVIKYLAGTTTCKTTPDVRIFPPAKCLEPGSGEGLGYCFGKLVLGAVDQSVTWEAIHRGEPYPIKPNGCFSFPKQPGVMVVTATSVANPKLKAEAQVRVGECGCWFGVLHEGSAVNGTGDQAIVQFGFNEEEIIGINLFLGNDAVTIFPASLPEGIPAGARYFFPVKAGGTAGLPPGTLFSTPENAALPVLTLRENNKLLVAGEINGTVVITEAGTTPSERPARLSISFNIEKDETAIPGQLSCTVD